MTLQFRSILDSVVSHALASGWFEQVNTFEPKSAPGNGLTAAIWIDRIEPVKASGLDQTSGRLVLTVRITRPMLAQPEDEIDPNLMDAASDLMAAYSGDFTFDGKVRQVDLLGAYGAGLSAQAGYLNQDNRLYRTIVVTVPLIVNDIWEQVA